VDAFPLWLVGFALALAAPWAVSLLLAAVESRVRRRTAEVLGPLRTDNRELGERDDRAP
jgi:hypothetical protein